MTNVYNTLAEIQRNCILVTDNTDYLWTLILQELYQQFDMKLIPHPSEGFYITSDGIHYVISDDEKQLQQLYRLRNSKPIEYGKAQSSRSTADH